MTPNTTFRQCNLKKGNVEVTNYIPSQFARKDLILSFLNPDNSWDDGWVINSIGYLVNRPCVEANSSITTREPNVISTKKLKVK